MEQSQGQANTFEGCYGNGGGGGGGFPTGSAIKNPPAMQEMLVRSLGWEDPLGKEMATHSSTLTWEIP